MPHCPNTVFGVWTIFEVKAEDTMSILIVTSGLLIEKKNHNTWFIDHVVLVFSIL